MEQYTKMELSTTLQLRSILNTILCMKEFRKSSRAPSTTSPSLRERTRLAMRTEVSQVAFRLFAEQGFDKTTVDQIAGEAGLSRTTFFRYFGTKEEIVLEKIGEFGREVAAALAARPEAETPWCALRRSFDLVTQVQDDDARESLSLMRLLNDACALMTRQWENTHGWQSMLVPVLSRRLHGGEGQKKDLRAQVLVASAVACLGAATDAWSACDGTGSLAEFLDQAMGVLYESGTGSATGARPD
ncbi:TetR family transcriptional regulator [Dickeya solani]|uniref:TetR family transcriptional regulator n=1 Tax=Dickeya solani TaxID=1089444 RepID=A0AAX4EVI4_9GAMM|nr:TetR family transcriptional regulator [Dickeya solani]WOA51221.1 TetR family transcriptional regulator [Dickeya solani]